MVASRPSTKLLTVSVSYLIRSMSLQQSSQVTPSSSVSISLPWGTISGKTWGDPSGKPVLAMHGWLDNAGSFDQLAPHLSKELYIVAIDLPGHGLSSHRPPGTHYHFIDYVADVKLIIKELGWTKFSLLCHSLGGCIGQMFAAAQSEFIDNMVVIEAIGLHTRPTENLPKLMNESLNAPLISSDTKVYPTFDQILKRMKEGHTLDPNLPMESLQLLAIRGTTKVEGGYKFTRDLRLKQRSILYLPDAIDEPFLKALTFPTLVVMFEDSFLKPLIKQKMDLVSKDKVKLVMSAGGHHAHMYNGHVIAPLIDQFLMSSSIHSSFQVAKL